MEVKSLNFRRVGYYSKKEKLKAKLAGESWQACESGPQISEFSWGAAASKGRVEHKREKIIQVLEDEAKGHLEMPHSE